MMRGWEEEEEEEEGWRPVMERWRPMDGFDKLSSDHVAPIVRIGLLCRGLSLSMLFAVPLHQLYATTIFTGSFDWNCCCSWLLLLPNPGSQCPKIFTYFIIIM